jgi:myo-inositol-1(or 4)-monophosphatase
MALSANVNVMIRAARKAGRTLVRDFGEVEQLQVSTKGPGDFVTRADRQAEATIREALMEARPTYGYLGEEEGAKPGQDPTRRWIVDPLDGTTNFLHGLPHWAVSIALEHKGQVVAGVVHDPVKDETFFAERGEGAWLNESRLRVSGRTRMSESIFATGVPFGAQRSLPATLGDLARLMPECAGVRRMGVASLDLAYVAAGRYEGYWERETRVWDVAAGLVIVTEAGGLVGPVREGGRPLEDGEVIAANAAVFERFAAVIRGGE